MPNKQCQVTVLDCLAPCHRETARELLRRAALCSHLAKLSSQGTRAKLYALKNKNIRAALTHAAGDIDVHVDRDRYRNLLSVQLRGEYAVRVHTHENWIGVA